MLWHKGWLETRWNLLFILAWDGLFLGLAYVPGGKTLAGLTAVLIGGAWLGAFIPILLAGAGINTQPAFQATKGLHGSTLFTLSLPVSRSRLLAVRASLGFPETAVAIGDDLWRLYGSMLVFVTLWWVFDTIVPSSANIFRAMGEGSPMVTHTMPCAAVAISLALAASLFVVARMVVQSREY